MKRGQLALCLCLLLGLALWLTWGLWLPPLLRALPSGLAPGYPWSVLGTVVNLFFILVNGVLAFLLSRSWRRGRETAWLTEPLRPIPPDQLRRSLGRGGQVNWIDRGVCCWPDLHAHRRLLIVGRTGLGKTREAAELMRQAVLQGLVPRERIYEPTPLLYLSTGDRLRAALDPYLTPQVPLLLFLDDLPDHVLGEGLDQLGASLRILQRCKALYVVATARPSRLTAQHKAWLDEQGFRCLDLPDFTREQIGRLVDNAAGIFGFQVEDAARDEFIRHHDGTPELVLTAMRRLRIEKIKQVDQDAVAALIQGGLGEAWAEMHRYLKGHEAATVHLWQALAVFGAAAAEPYTPLVLRYAAHLMPGSRRLRRRRTRESLERALAYLAVVDVLAGQEQITFPAAAVEGAMLPATARERLGTFLEFHRRSLHRPGLRRLYREAEPHAILLLSLGLFAQWQREQGAAVRFYSAALRLRPHPEISYRRGLAFAARAEWKKAIADFSRTLDSRPRDVEATFQRGLAYQEQGQPRRAIADLSRVIELDAMHEGAYFNRGLVHASRDELEEAIADYTRVIELDPDHALAHYHRGLAYYYQGRLTQAIADFGRTIELDPDCSNAYYNRGLAYQQQDDLERAIADYDRAIELEPDGANAYYNRGLAHAELDQEEKALADFGRAIELEPEQAKAHYQRGLIHYNQGRLKRAIADYDRAIELEPDHALVYLYRGLALYAQDEVEPAVADFSRAIELDPELSLAYYQRGVAHFHGGEMDQAKADFSRTIELEPEHADARYNRGLIDQQQGRLESAIADFGWVIELKAQDAAAYYHRGVAYADLGQLEPAIADLTQAIELEPEHAALYHHRGLAYRSLGDLEQAIADLSQAIELDPKDASAYHNRGGAYYLRGQVKQAIADYGRAIELNPRYANAYFNRGLAYQKQGEVEEAIADLSQALELDPHLLAAFQHRAALYLEQGEVEPAGDAVNIAGSGRGASASMTCPPVRRARVARKSGRAPPCSCSSAGSSQASRARCTTVWSGPSSSTV